MAKTTDRLTTRDQLNVRVSRAQRDLIDQAAASLGKTRTDFILESAVREAQQVLLDQVFFSLDEDAFKQVAALLDHPPAPSAALRDLLSARAPWE